MPMKRTNIYVDPEDLALVREAARRRGVPAAEVIREGIRLAAMSNRDWDQPLDWPTFDGSGENASSAGVTAAVAEGAHVETPHDRCESGGVPGRA
ncbi:CopG family transcriptional regulator [Nocardiopsis rhodophaea]